MAKMIRLLDAESQIRASIANALASALICGIDECEENERPLTQLQKEDLAKYSIMAYAEAIEGCENLGLDASVDVIRARISGGGDR